MSDLIIGLTGGIGSGKTTVSDIFATLDIDIIDADIVAREVVEPGNPALKAIAEQFGSDFIQDDGYLNRSKLRHHIFSNPDAKQWINNLLHPLIRNAMLLQCQAAQSPYCILVAPLLIENGINSTVDKVIVVDVSRKTQIARTATRDNNSTAQIEKIISSQLDRHSRLAHADYIISNESDLRSELKGQVENLHQKLLDLKKVKK